MHLKTIGDTAKYVRQESRNYIRDLLDNIPRPSSEREASILTEIDRVGFSVVPNYYPADACAAIRDEIDNLLVRFASTVHVDALKSDHRIFASDRVSELIKPFYADPFISTIVTGYERSHDISGFTLAAKLVYRKNNLGSGLGWHRDRADRRQIKAIMYLSDVDIDLGPFQYIVGSHTRSQILKTLTAEGFEHNQTRFTDEQAESVIAKAPEKLRTLLGPAGTLVLVDTRGIHRGMPMEKDAGNRYALTNYYWAKQGIPEHIAKLMVTATPQSDDKPATG